MVAVFALFLGVALLRAVGIVARRLGAGVMQYRMQAHTRREVTRQYLALPMEWHHRHPTGQLLSNANSDVEAAWGPIAPLPMAVGVLAMMVIAVAQMFLADVVMAVVGLLVFPAVVVANLAYQRLASPLMTKAQQLRAELSEVAHESFDGAMVVKTLGREAEETARFAEKAHQLRDVNIRAGRIRAAFDPTLAALPNLGVLVVLVVGVERVLNGATDAGDVVTSPTCSRSSPSRSARSAGCWVSSRAASSATTGCARCCGRPARCRTATHRLTRTPTAGARLEVDGVGYRYDADQPLLEDISFTVEPGRTVALVGATASGKSTLTTLMARLVDPDEGRLGLDGTDLRDFGARRARRGRRLVPQTAFLFDDTVRGNVTLGADVADDEVWAALRAAQADGFVAALPEGSTAGWASAAPRCPAASGSGSPWPVRSSAGRGCWSSTTRPRRSTPRSRRGSWPPCAPGDGGTRRLVVVAYRKATIGLADEVVHLEDGRIADRGTHAELLARSPAYARLVNAYEQTGELGRREETPHERHAGMDTGEDIGAIETIRRGVAGSPELKDGSAGRSSWPSWPRRAGRGPGRRAADPRPGHQRPRRPRRLVHGADGLVAARGDRARQLGVVPDVNAAVHHLRARARTLRVKAFRHVHDLSVLTQNTERRGALVSRVTSDVDQVSQFLVFGGLLLIVSVGQVLVATVVMLIYSWQLAHRGVGVLRAAVPLDPLLPAQLSAAYGVVRRQVAVMLCGLRAGRRGRGREVLRDRGRTQERIDEAIDEYRRPAPAPSGSRSSRSRSAGSPPGLANAGVLIVGIQLGLHVGLRRGLTAGEVLAFAFLVTLFVGPVQMGTQIFTDAQNALVGWRRVIGILETPADLVDPGPDGQVLPRGPIDVSLRGRRLRLPGRAAGAARHRPRHRGGHPGRHRRRDRLGQVDDRQVAHPTDGPARWARAARRRRRA